MEDPTHGSTSKGPLRSNRVILGLKARSPNDGDCSTNGRSTNISQPEYFEQETESTEGIGVTLATPKPHTRLPFGMARTDIVSRPQGQGIPIVDLENPREPIREIDRSIRPCTNLCQQKWTNLTESSLRLMRIMYNIADDVEMTLLADHENPGWFVPGWHFFYLDTLRCDIKFPIKGMAETVLDHYNIAPSQLCPRGWKIMLALDMLAESQGL